MNSRLKHFVIAIDTSTAPERDTITNSIEAAGCGFWHWLPDFWLVGDPDFAHSPDWWRDRVRALAPSRMVMVLEVSPRMWAGYVPEDTEHWMSQTWTD